MEAQKNILKTASPRKNCGTCRWYDGLGDLCRNEASPRSWTPIDRRERCAKWEAERKGDAQCLKSSQ